MCGIAAIFRRQAQAGRVDPDELRVIRDCMETRGPDGHGEWFSDDGRAALGHRRLSIIDLSDRASQPMTSRDGRLVITFNGEIYNYQELRAQLAGKGRAFVTTSDTEVLLHLYEEHGPAMLPMLRGMFAFVIWDNTTGSLFAARDPLGIKPLYYSDTDGALRFASQVKAIAASGKSLPAVNPAGAVGFLLWGSVPEPHTWYEGIYALPAGSYMIADERGAREPVSYFSLPALYREKAHAVNGSLSAGEYYETAREALLESVRYHMIADVKVGAFLSAGMDSTSLVGLMRDAGVEDIETVTLAFEEFHGRHDDEAPLAESAARHYGTAHRTRMLTAREFAGDLDAVLHAMDQPSIDGLNSYFVSKAAAEQGWKVVLSGLGGDELFGGYNTFHDVPRWVRMFGVPSRIPGFGKAFRGFYQAVAPGRAMTNPKTAGAFEFGGTYEGAYYLRRGLFMPWDLPRIADEGWVREGFDRLQLSALAKRAIEPDPGTPFGRVACLEAGLYMKNQLLRDSDWAGMAHSLEIRVPYVDSILHEKLCGQTVRFGLEHGKRPIVMSPRTPPPPEIALRKKTGFQVPIQAWLQEGGKLDVWRNNPSLNNERVPWARRWAYTLLHLFPGAPAAKAASSFVHA